MAINAHLTFTPKANASTLAAPAQPAEPNQPGTITLSNGRKAKVKVEIQINGTWQEIDASKVGEALLSNLADKSQKIYAATTHATDQPSSFTVYFQQNNAAESWKSAILGKVADRFKDNPLTLEFKKIEYKATDSSKTEVFDTETHELDDAVTVKKLVDEIAPFAHAIFTNSNQFVIKAKKIKHNPPSNELQAIEQILNVKDAGADKNRCAALSVAAILLNKHNNNLKAAAAEFQIPISEQDNQSDLIKLSNGLINLAATTIESNPVFSEQNSYYNNIVAALRSTGQSIKDEELRSNVVQRYATLIRQPGQMLDVPFFDALSIRGIPFITLVRSPLGTDFICGSISNTIRFEKSIDDFDVTKVCIVVHEGLHYRAVILDKNPNPAQNAKLCSILRNNLNNTLSQISKVAADQKMSYAGKATEIEKLLISSLTQYPFDAKNMIIQTLRNTSKKIDENAIDFVKEAKNAFLGLIPAVEQID